MICIRKESISITNNLSFHFKKLENEEQIKYKESRRKKIKFRAKINEIKNGKEKENQ